MSIRSLIAFIVFAVLTLMGILSGGALSDFIDTPSALLTVGGGLLLALISYPFRALLGAIGTGFGRDEVAGQAADEAMRVLGGLGSAFVSAGFIGTLIGLINLSQNIDDIETLGPGLATAAITLYYGIFLKYAILDPLKRSVEHRKV